MGPILYGIGAVILVFVLYSIGSVAVLMLTSGAHPTLSPRLMPLGIGAAQLLLMFVPAVLLARARGGSAQRVLRFGKADISMYVAVVLGVLALGPLIETFMLVQEIYLVPHAWHAKYLELQHMADDTYEQLLNAGGGWWIGISFLVGSIIPGLSEETLFRGLVQGSFERRLPPGAAIALAAFIFGLLHFQVTFLPLVGVGALLGYAAWASESILPSIVGHAAFNAVAIMAINLPDAPSVRAGDHTAHELVGSLPAAAIGGILLTGAILWIREVRRRGEERRSQQSLSESTDL